MRLNRRDFLKLSGSSLGGLLLYKALASEGAEAAPRRPVRLHKPIGERTTICPYDASGCGFIVATENGRVVNIEGDPEHPINLGAGCAKGASIRQLSADNPRRLTRPLYRRAGGTEWEEMDWDSALDGIAGKIKATRDADWISTDGAVMANRTERIACLGGAAHDNEECYLLVKMMRALGLVYIEHQARI